MPKVKEKPLKRRNNDNENIKLCQPKLRRMETRSSSKIVRNARDDFVNPPKHQQFMIHSVMELTNLKDFEQNIDYCLLSKALTQSSHVVAELKWNGIVDLIVPDKQTILIDRAMRNVDDAENLSIPTDAEADDIKQSIDTILSAAEACLFVCNLYVIARDANFLRHATMQKIAKFVQWQMCNTIFPAYDQLYSSESTEYRDEDGKTNDSNGVSRFSRKFQLLYTKLVAIIKQFDALFDNFTFVDSIVFSIATVAVKSLFVDKIVAMQFACFQLIKTIFRKNVNCRNRIFNIILSSIDRMPHSKRNLRPFKLAQNDGSIQMVTALILQLMQSSTVFPENAYGKCNNLDRKIDKDIVEKWNKVVDFGENVLKKFLSKCMSRSDRSDCLPLFAHFVNDLLTTVNRPEWPASELLLSLLGTLLGKYVSNETKEQSIRIVALNYLCIILAGMEKYRVKSGCCVQTIDQLINSIKIEYEKDDDNDDIDHKIMVDHDEQRIEFLQRILMDFLSVNAEYDDARQFYWTHRYQDVVLNKRCADGGKEIAMRRHPIDDVTEVITDELNVICSLDTRRRKYLLSYSQNRNVRDIKSYIGYGDAYLICQYLASKRQLTPSIEEYLPTIIRMGREVSIGIRINAIKCLAMIIAIDPSILNKEDMQIDLNQHFSDASKLVRKAAVDLVGKCVLKSPHLIEVYYDLLTNRITDTGASVRKLVIKILRDFCIAHPDYDKSAQICANLISHTDSKEILRKLVSDAFMRMWFMPCASRDQASSQRKTRHILDVVGMAGDISLQWLNGLLTNIFMPKRVSNAWKNKPAKHAFEACQQIVDDLVNVLVTFETFDSERALNCPKVLHLLTKAQPKLLVKHTITLVPYLNVKSDSQNGLNFIMCVTEILEQALPLMKNPSKTFLAKLEVRLIMLAYSLNQTVGHSCFSCFAAIINKITKNYALVRRLFLSFYQDMIEGRTQLQAKQNGPKIRSCLFTIGLIFRYFDFQQTLVYGDDLELENAGLPSTICSDTFEHLVYFGSLTNKIGLEALIALGHFGTTNPDYLTNAKLRELFCDVMASDKYDINAKIIVLRNAKMYLCDGDASTPIKDINQLYLQDVLNCLLHSNETLRWNAMDVVQQILRQNLFRSIQKIVPHLLCLSTYKFRANVNWVNQHLEIVNRQYPCLIHCSTLSGMQLSFELQTILQNHGDCTEDVVRGFTVNQNDNEPAALNGFLYTLLRNNIQQRRAFFDIIIHQFDQQRTTFRHMVYMADNLAYFPYAIRAELLDVLEKISNTIIIAEANSFETFEGNLNSDEDDPPDRDAMQQLVISLRPLILLSVLREHLQTMYNISDTDIMQYSPSDSVKKDNEAVQKVPVPQFHPKTMIVLLSETEGTTTALTAGENKRLAERYWEELFGENEY